MLLKIYKIIYGKGVHMGMRNVVIFDLFGTILIEESHDWKTGLKYVFDKFLNTNDFSQVLDAAKEFKDKNMSNRSITYKEPRMIDQLELFQERFGFKGDVTFEDVEYYFLDNSRTVSINEGVKEVFEYLRQENVETYIMSNTIYSSNTIRRYLDKLDIGDSISGIFTSADFGYRKPHMDFYNYVFSKVNYDNSIERKDIVFIGDSLTKDAIAGRDFGFRTVLISDDQDDLRFIDKNIKVVKNLIDYKNYLVNDFISINSFLSNYSMSDGPGNRLVLFVQGCERHCEGCQNKESWDKTKGKRVHIDDLVIDVLYKLNKYTRNLTVSGGEPLDQQIQVAQFLKRLKNFDINLCLYTGYEFDEVDSLILENLDYIKTGKYIDNQKDTTNGHYGSKNQNMWVKGETGQWTKMIEK